MSARTFRATRHHFIKLVPTALALAALALAPSIASASQTFGFTDISSSNNTTDGSTFGQYSVTVYGSGESFNFGASPGSGNLTVGSGQVLFVFQNTGVQQSTITDVYFQDGTLLNLSTIYNTANVNYVTPATPSDLSAGNSISPNFQTTKQFSANPTDPQPANGVTTSSDAVGILFTLQSGLTSTDTINALIEGINNPSAVWDSKGKDISGGPLGLRVGIHVQNFANGGSESFITAPPTTTVPEPTPIALAVSGLGALGFAGLCRARRKATTG
jgi:hypothetical protein